MARFDSLNFRFTVPRLPVGALLAGMVLGSLAGFSTPLTAQQMPMTPQTPAPPAAATPAPAKPAVTASAPAKAPAPPTAPPPGVPPNTLGQYGNILAPGDQVEHPLKLRIPGPGVGEVKIPSPEELTMRDKLEELAKLSDQDIRTKLDKWPPYGKMSLRDQGSMLQRIQDFRDYRSNVAKSKAHDIGLLTLTPDQEAKFEKEYWDKRLVMDRDLAKQFAPIYQQHVQKLQDDLYREFSTMSQGPVAQGPKPPVPPAPSGPKPSAPGAPAVSPTKPVVSASATNNAGMPIAQGPH